MALPAQLKAKAAGEGYLRLTFVQGDEEMATSHGQKPAEILLQYPRQGRMMRNPGDPYLEETRARELNEALESFNTLLAGWCS